MNQQLLDEIFNQSWGVLRGALVVVLGPLNLQIGYLLLVLALDLYLGIKVALKEHKFSFRYMGEKTLEKTITYGVWIAISHAFDMVTRLPGTARWLCIVTLLGWEVCSSLKSTRKLGYKVIADGLEDMFNKQRLFPKSKPRKPRSKKGGKPDGTGEQP
jgi:phage-related holin